MVVKKSDKPSIVARPPVVCVLGHVDHGKTTLLDYIRKTKVALGESGGITQHIGAYQIEVKSPKLKVKSLITFIDTPGHVAFAKLRARGAQVTDLAVLVIDAVEGVKPQTVESLQHIRQAKIPFLVAINKMDLPGASAEGVKAALARGGVFVEGGGGDVISVPISAKTGKGVDELLEMIILLAQMQELKADLKAVPQVVVIEAKLDSRKGPMATLLVKNGVLKVGQFVKTEGVGGKIKAMFDENGRRVLQAPPSKPAEVLGFRKVPKVGSKVKVVEKSDRAKTTSRIQRFTEDFGTIPKTEKTTEETEEKLKVILKADVFGSLEAIKDSLPEEVLPIFEGIGEVTESDVLLAASTSAKILAFQVSIPVQVKKLARFEKVTIVSYKIIYRLLEDIEKGVLKLLEPEIEEEVLGEAWVIAEFRMKGNHIAGCQVKKGKITKSLVHVKRSDKLIADAKIKSLQKNRQDVQEGKVGEELGIVFSCDVDFALGDVIISYKKKTLS